MHLLHVGRDDQAGHFFYVMELGDDERWGQDIEPQRYSPKTLQTELHEQGRIPAAQCVQIGIALADALSHLHEDGLIHRDLKPANIIFVKGVPKLADIGLVTGAMDDRSRVGTDGFMPPEGSGSRSADLYALGKVLYEMGMGKDRQQFPQLPADFRDHPDRGLLTEINHIVLKACSNDVRQRYASAAQMLADLATIRQGHSLMAARRAGCRRTFLNWAVGVLLALMSVLWLWTRTQTVKARIGRRWTTIPPGSVEQIPIELAGFYNRTLNEPMFGSNTGNDLSGLPRGAQVFEDVTFVCGGIVQVASPLLKKDGYSVPELVPNIPVFRYCRRLYFLHATGGDAEDGTTIAHFVVHYADGHRLGIPLVYGLDLRNWWIDPRHNQETPRAVIAWTGTNPETRSRGNIRIRLFKSKWENPRPQVPLTTIDYVSNMVGWTMPFLVAATAEGWPRAEESQLGSRRVE